MSKIIKTQLTNVSIPLSPQERFFKDAQTVTVAMAAEEEGIWGQEKQAEYDPYVNGEKEPSDYDRILNAGDEVEFRLKTKK